MAKTLVVNDTNPNIMIELTVDNEDDGRWDATPCTQCGYQCRSRWSVEDVQQEAEIHIDRHDGEE